MRPHVALKPSAQDTIRRFVKQRRLKLKVETDQNKRASSTPTPPPRQLDAESDEAQRQEIEDGCGAWNEGQAAAVRDAVSDAQIMSRLHHSTKEHCAVAETVRQEEDRSHEVYATDKQTPLDTE